jgi:hypothetical protein
VAFRRSDLQEAFFVPGTQPFRVYGYGTADPLEAVPAPGYFEPARGLPGELIYVSTCPGAPRGSGADHGAARMALVMVRADARDGERAGGAVRLVQDFGAPGDPSGILGAPAPPAPDLSAAPVKRGRGRPPGSKTRKRVGRTRRCWITFRSR